MIAGIYEFRQNGVLLTVGPWGHAQVVVKGPGEVVAVIESGIKSDFRNTHIRGSQLLTGMYLTR